MSVYVRICPRFFPRFYDSNYRLNLTFRTRKRRFVRLSVSSCIKCLLS